LPQDEQLSGQINDSVVGMLKWPLLVMLVSMLFFMAYQAEHYAEAYAAQHRVYMKLASWNKSSVAAPTVKQWQVQEKRMKNAIALMPGNAAFLNTLGRLYEFRAFRMEAVHDQLSNGLNALSLFRQATHASPAWVYPWINLALTKARLNQMDAEFGEATLNVIQLGPWEADTMALSVELGMRAYGSVDPAQWNMVVQYIHRVVDIKGEYLRNSYATSGRIDVICNQLYRLIGGSSYEKVCY